MFQSPIPPGSPAAPHGPALLFFACLLLVIATVEMIVFNLPVKWRNRISVVQFGLRWIAKRRERP